MKYYRVTLMSFLVGLGLAAGYAALISQPASALGAIDFDAGHVIDDAIFTNNNAMTVGQIQDFLNAKVGSCDVNGTTPSSHYNSGAGRYYTRAEWGAIGGDPAPYTCVNIYVENPSTKQNNYSSPGSAVPGGISAAQIIYNAAQQYKINPQVLITTLQKEQGLITDSWPYYYQYRSAMGFGCPDTAACDTRYYGFYNQVDNAAYQMRYYITHPGAFNYWIGNNYVRYNPSSSCGGSVINIRNAATAALYIYTPYQPNQAALQNLNGTGDSCSAYGVRNFWRYFNTWFGASTVDTYVWTIETPLNGDGRYWLVIGNTKRWIPNGAIMRDWNLDTYSVEQVPQSRIDSIPTLPNLANFGITREGNYVFVDDGQRYALNNTTNIDNWGYTTKLATAVPLYSILSAMPYQGTGTVNQFVRQTGSSATYLMSAGILFPINASYINRWNIGAVTNISADTIATMPAGQAINYQISFGGNNFIADNGSLLVADSQTASAYGVTGSFVPVNTTTGTVFPLYKASTFIQPGGSSNCYLLLDGKKYYVLNGDILNSWGSFGNAQYVTPALGSSIPDGGLLGSIAQTPSASYVVDGSARAIAPSLAAAFTTGLTSMQTTEATLSDQKGAAISSPMFQINGTPNIFTAINGKYYHVGDGRILNAYGYPDKYDLMHVNSSALFSLPFGGGLSQIVTYGGITYYLQSGKAYPIDSQYVAKWLGNSSSFAYPGSDFAQRFAIQSTTLNDLVRDSSGTSWLIDAGKAIDISSYADAYGFRTVSNVDVGNMPKGQGSSYLARSSTQSDSRIWLINQGTKQWIVTGAEYSAYNGPAVQPTILSDAMIASIPNAATPTDPSLLISSPGKGLKLLASGVFYGMPDGPTANSLIGAKPVLTVSPSVFNALSRQAGNISRTIKDPSTQQIYYLESGQKRWITSGSAYAPYTSLPLVTLPQDAVQWLPSGNPIN